MMRDVITNKLSVNEEFTFYNPFLALVVSCSDDVNEPDALQDSEATARIDGTSFEPAETKATNNGHDLEIKLKGDDQEITLYLDDKVAGSYSVKNTHTGGRRRFFFHCDCPIR